MNDDAWWLKKKDVCLFNKEDVSENDWSWSNSRKFFIVILLIDLILYLAIHEDSLS